MRAVKILLRVITLVVVLTVSSAAALASPAVSDNYQKIPLNGLNVGAVSYTHLDVYKRQTASSA